MTMTKSKSLVAIIAIIFLPIEASVETKNIKSCTEINDDIQRLSCFDSFFNEDDNSIEVFCVVSTYSKTGVEMEAIMGVNAALITIYDLSKIVNANLKIDNIKLLIKEGGKSGLWKNPEGIPNFLKELF